MIRRREILALPLLGVVPRAIAQNFHCGILVVGAGGAGLAAALEASAYSDSVVLIEKESFRAEIHFTQADFSTPPTRSSKIVKASKTAKNFICSKLHGPLTAEAIQKSRRSWQRKLLTL